MGASSSVSKPSAEQLEEESLAASTGSLPMLQSVFAKLSAPKTGTIPLESLQEIFSLSVKNLQTEVSPIPEHFPDTLASLGSSIVHLFFTPGNEGVNWIDFLRGYNKSCGRLSSSESICNLYKLYSTLGRESGFETALVLEHDKDAGKITGNIKLIDALMLLWICWIMGQSTKFQKYNKELNYILPDIQHLINSIYLFSGETVLGDSQNFHIEKEIPLQKFHMWVLTTIPGLSHCYTQYISSCLHNCISSKDDAESSSSSVGGICNEDVNENCLLTCGRAWGISLSFRDTVREELCRACLPDKSSATFRNLLYRSTFHGKGLSRFWSNVEGYNGPVLLLLSIQTWVSDDESRHVNSVIGVLTSEGFENKDTFYGDQGYIYALSPVFHIFPPSGKGKNFVYSRLHPSVRRYDPHPKPIGLGFGGTVGNERIFIDEDFSKATIRHHAVDKTYKPGSLFPNQGFLAVEAFIVEIEAWGLGGRVAREQQEAYKRREELFSEQRRKVDLKTFASWEDSPEKMMMDMITDPNRVQREDR